MEAENLDRVRKMAESLDCFIEEDVQILANATKLTVEAWRKRGTGPEHILFGRRPLYPREPLKQFLENRRKQKAHTARELL